MYEGFYFKFNERVENITVTLQVSKIKLREVTRLLRILIPGKHTTSSQIFLFLPPLHKYVLSAC